MNKLLIIFFMTIMVPVCCNGQGNFLKKFFSPVPPPAQSVLVDMADDEVVQTGSIRPIGVMPSIAFGFREDYWEQSLLTGGGFGISYQFLDFEDGSWKSGFTIAPAVLILEPLAEDTVIPYYAFYLGIFDNRLMLGVSKELTGQKEIRILMTLGIPLN